MIVAHLPLKQVDLNLLGEALADPRNMLPLRIEGFRRSLIEEKTKSIAKTFKGSRSGGAVRSRLSELDAFDSIFNHHDGVLKLREKEAKNALTEVPEVTEITLGIGVKA